MFNHGWMNMIKYQKQNEETLTCKWLFTSSFVRLSTCISSLICLGVATAKQNKPIGTH